MPAGFQASFLLSFQVGLQMSETVLILGGTGVIGSHLARCLTERGMTVKVLSRSSRFAAPEAIGKEIAERIELVAGDINDQEILAELVQQADIIMHKTAASGMAGATDNARDYVHSNIGGAANLIDVLGAGKHKVRRVILGSSTSVYGEGAYQCGKCGPVRPALRYKLEHDDWNPRCPACASSVVPIATAESAERLGESVYSIAKKAQEDLLLGACHRLGIDLVTLRYSTIIGPSQSWHNQYTRFLESFFAGQPPLLHEDGQQSRDLIAIEDVVAANLLALERPAGTSVFNIGRGEDVSLLDFVTRLGAAVARVTGGKAITPEVDLKFVKGDVRHCRLDCSKAGEKLGFQTQVPLSQSIAELVDWFAAKKGITTKSKADRL